MFKLHGGVAILCFFAAVSHPAAARTWTDRIGRTFEAEFVKVDGANVILALPGGRNFSTPVIDLSPADREHLAAAGKQEKPGNPKAGNPPNFTSSWPPSAVRLEGAAICKVVSEDAAAGRR